MARTIAVHSLRPAKAVDYVRFDLLVSSGEKSPEFEGSDERCKIVRIGAGEAG